MADKSTSLSIVIRTVDDATARIKAINKQLDAINKPTKDLKKAFSDLAEKSGLDKVVSGFKGVGSAVTDVLGKVALIGGVAAIAVGGLFHLVDKFDDLGKKAERLGVGVDFLAGMRDAALRTGVPMEALDEDLQTFSQNVGQATAHTGRMYKFLTQVSPVLRDQVIHAKNNAAAFDLIAQAMAKVTDPAKRAALAQKVFGDSALAPLFAKGAKGIKELRERYIELAGSQEGAVKQSEEVAESMHDLHATVDGIEAALITGFGPALKQIVDELASWFKENRERIAEWAKDFGEKLPAAIHKFADGFFHGIDAVSSFVKSIGGIKTVAEGALAILAGPLIKAVVELGLALLTAGGRAVALARGMGGIPSGVGGAAGAAGGAAGAAGTGAGGAAAAGAGAGIISSIAIPVGIGYGAKYLLDKAGLGDLGGGNELARKAGPGIFSDWLKQGGYATEPGQSPAELVQRGVDTFRDANNTRDTLGSSFGGAGGVIRGVGVPAAVQGSNKITVDFTNAPRGTRVKADPQNTDDVDLSIGYLLGGGA